MKLVKVLLLFVLAIIVTFSACKKEELPEIVNEIPIEISNEIVLTSSIEYPLGVVNKWNLLSGISSYKLFRSIDAENYEIIKILDSNTNTYFDDSAFEGIVYQYYIEGISADSNIISNFTSGKAVLLSTENSFSLLANLTGGVYNTTTTDSLCIMIASIIDSFATDSADIMLLIDKTGSMMDDILAVQIGLTLIIDAMPAHCRLGLASYGDLVSDSVWIVGGMGDWYDFEDLTFNHNDIQSLVNSLSTTGGGDWSESVFDGLHRTIEKADWQSDNKLLLVIGDAPPLVTPCNLPLTPAQPVECTMHSIIDVVTSCFANNVVTNLYPIVVPVVKGGEGN